VQGGGRSGNSWTCFTECSLPLPHDKPTCVRKFRCHPNYRGEGPWYDWVIVKFKGNLEERPTHYARGTHRFQLQYRSDHVPCKLLGIVKQPDAVEPVALVHACEYSFENLQKQSSVLIEPWRLEYEKVRDQPIRGSSPSRHLYRARLRLVSLEAIETRCFVVQEHPGLVEYIEDLSTIRANRTNPQNDHIVRCVILVRDRERWPAEFMEYDGTDTAPTTTTSAPVQSDLPTMGGSNPAEE